MKILYGKEVIELTAKEAHDAQIYGSPAYTALMDAKSHFGSFRVEVKGKTHSVTIKGLDRKFMRKHIEENPKEDRDLMAEFNTLCGLDENGNKKAFAAVASYGELRMWFLNEYPEFTETRSEIAKILDKTREEIAAKRAA